MQSIVPKCSNFIYQVNGRYYFVNARSSKGQMDLLNEGFKAVLSSLSVFESTLAFQHQKNVRQKLATRDLAI